MSYIPATQTNWYPDQQLIITQISGDLDRKEIIQWEQSLKEKLNQLPESARFRIFVNLHGFTALNLEAHKYFRNIIPLILSDYGWKVGYVNLFPEEAAKVPLQNHRNIQCVAAAHCHHDNTKMEKYESLFSRENEHFFVDPRLAEEWIRDPERVREHDHNPMPPVNSIR